MSIVEEQQIRLANKVSLLNHTFRANPNSGSIPGQCVITQGIAALSPLDQMQIAHKVTTFTEFTEEHAPYDWHDFGSFDHNGTTIFWKIDIFDNEDMEFGAETPDDPSQSYRLLTILLASEY